MRGVANPAPRIVASASVSASSMRCGVIWSSAVAQRHVRGHARHPLVVEHVHLAEEALVAGEVREHLVLVVELPAAGVQRRLVERREQMPSMRAVERQVDHDA